MAKILSTIVVALLLLAGCGGSSSASGPTTTVPDGLATADADSEAGPDSTTSTTSTSTTSTSTTSTSTTSTIDPYVANHDLDMRLINDHFINLNNAAKSGWGTLYEHLAEHAYPPGEWSVDEVACLQQQIAEFPDLIQSYQDLVDANDRDFPQTQSFVVADSVQPHRDWVIPETPAASGGGLVPDGRVYVMQASSNYVGDQQMHLTVFNETTYYFPNCG